MSRFNHQRQAAGYALGFLTRIPVPQRYQQAGDASPVVWFAPVGAVFGIALIGLAGLAVTLHLPPMAAAALVLAGWCGLSGALHLDGLADCADAWMSGRSGAPLRAALKDERTGTGAVTAVALALIIKFAALTELFYHLTPGILLVAPFMARAALACFLVETPYWSVGGLGAGLRAGAPRARVWGVMLLGLLMVTWTSLPLALAAIAGALLAVGLIQPLVKKLGGANGDVYGALVEIAECMVLVLGVAWTY